MSSIKCWGYLMPRFKIGDHIYSPRWRSDGEPAVIDRAVIVSLKNRKYTIEWTNPDPGDKDLYTQPISFIDKHFELDLDYLHKKLMEVINADQDKQG